MVNQKHFFIALVALVLTAGLILMASNRGVPLVLHTNLENLPTKIGEFIGRDDRFSPEIYDALPADIHVYRHYQSKERKSLSLYIGYYGTAKGGRTGHNPYSCLPGAGWGIIETGTMEVSPSYYPQGVKINFVVASRDGMNTVMFHWYQSDGNQVLASGLQQNIQRFKRRVLHNRNDGAYVQVHTLAQDKEIPMAKEMVKRFVLELLELLPKNWPEETLHFG